MLLSSVFIGYFFNPIVIAPFRNLFGIHTAFEAVGAVLLVAAAGLALRAIRTKSGAI